MRYTLAQLVDIVCPNEDERVEYRSARRFQNWVTAGLLRPVGDAHRGRGVHRIYDRHEIGKAAVLMELHRYQLPIGVLERVAGLFDDARPFGEGSVVRAVRAPSQGQRRRQRDLARPLERAWQAKAKVRLTLQAISDGDLRVKLGTELTEVEGASSMISIDLTAILTPLQGRLSDLDIGR